MNHTNEEIQRAIDNRRAHPSDSEIGILCDAAQEALRLRDGHCKDCCCARCWNALGVHEYTGKPIPEYITELRTQLSEAQKERYVWRSMYVESELQRKKMRMALEIIRADSHYINKDRMVKEGHEVEAGILQAIRDNSEQALSAQPPNDVIGTIKKLMSALNWEMNLHPGTHEVAKDALATANQLLGETK